jgi:DNA/RNA-binding domain of Phe-tRNA-synthetase-like protein
MALEVIRQIDDAKLALGLVEVRGGILRASSPALMARAAELAERIVSGWEIPEATRTLVRQALKSGGFSPTGRNRPAQEFLVNDIRERGEFNFICNVVDANNVCSLESMLPISIFDAEKLEGRLTIRIGAEGEGYVFNPAGHVLDVKRCVVCCRGAGAGEPCGTPVKDSMATKVFDGATHFAGVIYGATELYGSAAFAALTQGFAELIASETGGEVDQAVIL